MHFCRDIHDAEDLSQEVWLRAFRAIGTFRGESSFYTWLRRVLVNTFLNNHRGARLHLLASLPTEHDDFEPIDFAERASATPSFNLEQVMDNKLLVERVMEALQNVSPQQRLIFLLKHREGMTYQEIAELVGCSAGSAKKSVFRTVLRLRDTLGIQCAEPRFTARAAGEK
jgi:RNA polymerase sigma-70 factor (ECF subfamily)